MASPDLSARQLRAFIALADLRSFTKAASACNLSQPAFSAVIKALEESVALRLFKRDTRSVQLTPEGELFEPGARRLLGDMGEILDDLADHAERRKGRVRIAALPSLSAGWLPPIFAEFKARWPGVSVVLHDTLSEGCINLVRAGQVDFALAAYGTLPSSDLIETHLCTDTFHLLCRADHPLAKDKRITPEKIAAYPFIQLARPSSARQSLESVFRGIRLDVAYEVENLATIMGLVEAGLGISVIPTLTRFYGTSDALTIRPLKLPSLTRNVYIVQRGEGSISVAAQSMLDLIVARLGKKTFR